MTNKLVIYPFASKKISIIRLMKKLKCINNANLYSTKKTKQIKILLSCIY